MTPTETSELVGSIRADLYQCKTISDVDKLAVERRDDFEKLKSAGPIHVTKIRNLAGQIRKAAHEGWRDKLGYEA